MIRIMDKEAIDQKMMNNRSSISKKPTNTDLRRLYITGSKSMREVAEILVCSKHLIYYSIKGNKIDRGSNAFELKMFIFI